MLERFPHGRVLNDLLLNCWPVSVAGVFSLAAERLASSVGPPAHCPIADNNASIQAETTAHHQPPSPRISAFRSCIGSGRNKVRHHRLRDIMSLALQHTPQVEG